MSKKTKHRKKKLGRKGKKKKRKQKGGNSNDRHCRDRSEESCRAQEQAAFGCQWNRTDDDGDVYPGCTYNGPAFCEGKQEEECGVGEEKSDKKGCYWDVREQPAQCNYGGTSSDEESTYEYFSDGEEDGDADIFFLDGPPSQPCQLQVGNEIRRGCTNIRGPECTILPLTSSRQIDQTKYPYKTVTCADSATHLDAPPISNNNLLPKAVLLPESKAFGEGKAFQAKILSEGTEIPLADIGGKRKKRRRKRKKTRRKKSHRKTRRKRKTRKRKNKRRLV